MSIDHVIVTHHAAERFAERFVQGFGNGDICNLIGVFVTSGVVMTAADVVQHTNCKVTATKNERFIFAPSIKCLFVCKPVRDGVVVTTTLRCRPRSEFKRMLRTEVV